MLRSLVSEGLLDVGSGRGTFPWPLLDDFSDLTVTAIDEDLIRSRDFQAAWLEGIGILTGYLATAKNPNLRERKIF